MEDKVYDPITGTMVPVRKDSPANATLTQPPQSVSAPADFAPLQSRMASILQETDPAKQLQGAYELSNDMNSKMAQARGDTLKALESKLGVTSLEAQLAQAEALDRQHPMWTQNFTDSQETAAIRAQLGNARMTALNAVDKQLETNPVVAGAFSAFKNFENHINKLAVKAEDRNRAAESILDQKVLATSPEQMRFLGLNNPSVDIHTPDGQRAAVANAVSRSKDAAFVNAFEAASDPHKLSQLALLGNVHAINPVIQNRAESTGMPKHIVDWQVRQAAALTSNDAALLDFVTHSVGVFNTASKEKEMLRSALVKPASTKAAAEEKDAARTRVADAFLRKSTEQILSTDAAAWPGVLTLPESHPIRERITELSDGGKKKVGMNEFVKSYITPNMNKQEAAAKMGEIRSVFSKDLNRLGSGMGAINTLKMQQTLEKELLAAVTAPPTLLEQADSFFTLTANPVLAPAQLIAREVLNGIR